MIFRFLDHFFISDGDVIPGTDDERLFAIFAEIIGGGLFAFGLTNLITLVYNHNVHDVRFTGLLDDFNEVWHEMHFSLAVYMHNSHRLVYNCSFLPVLLMTIIDIYAYISIPLRAIDFDVFYISISA